MPQYLYECSVHGEFEYSHSIKEKLEFCPMCKEKNVEQNVKRLITKSSFVLAGSCWAKDNYS